MLLAVEVGGFFSSSASGYRNGLALLLLGHKGEEKPVKVTPWNHYRLVGGGEAEPASEENNVPSGKCASFICFGCPPARLKGVSKNRKSTTNGYSYVNESGIKGCLKNNLKRDSSERYVVSDAEDPRESLEEVQTLKAGMERRKVHWTNTCRKELFEIREFETRDEGLSDDEVENECFRKCECVIQ
ncbi:hypothetical protein DAI22_05g284300 [Oryza sativa Japonica Group]|nr:hypothetical protein DAI22_05g284300 [Oryza sativa Japonica Group]